MPPVLGARVALQQAVVAAASSNGASPLQPVVAAAARHHRVPAATNTATRSRKPPWGGARRGFIASSAARGPPPDESPETTSSSAAAGPSASTGGNDASDAAAANETAGSPPASSSATPPPPPPSPPAAPPPTVSATTTTTTTSSTSTPLTKPTPTESLREAFAGVVGRGRMGRSRSYDALPVLRLPEWFLNDRVRLHRPQRPHQTTLDSFRADLAAASQLVFPRDTNADTENTENTENPDKQLTQQEYEDMQQYLEAWLRGAAWDARKVDQARAHLREVGGAAAGDDLDLALDLDEAIQRRGLAVAAAATYLTAALACRPGARPEAHPEAVALSDEVAAEVAAAVAAVKAVEAAAETATETAVATQPDTVAPAETSAEPSEAVSTPDTSQEAQEAPQEAQEAPQEAQEAPQETPPLPEAGVDTTTAAAAAAADETTASSEPPPSQPPPPPPPAIDLTALDPDNALDLPRFLFGRATKDDLRNKLQHASPPAATTDSSSSPGPNLDYIAREADDAVTQGFPYPLGMDAGESLAFRELCATMATELHAVAPAGSGSSSGSSTSSTTASTTRSAGKDLRRPVSVLAIMNYRGRSKAVSLVDDVARILSADVVHLDAGAIADIIGPYLGQTTYWARGNLAMLGYAVAEKNGRMAHRYPSSGIGGGGRGGSGVSGGRYHGSSSSSNSHSRYDEVDDDDDDVAPASVLLSPRVPLAILKQAGAGGLLAAARMSAMRPSMYPSEMDDRWDDLKINNALEEMVRAADHHHPRGGQPCSHHPPNPQLLLHVHHFIELSSTPEGYQLLAKLRSIVDRLWQRGQKIVLVGSTSADMTRLSASSSSTPGSLADRSAAVAGATLLERAEDLRQEDCHIIPFRVGRNAASDAEEQQDLFDENMANIRAMIAALTAEPLNPAYLQWTTERKRWSPSNTGSSDGAGGVVPPELREALSATVYDHHWVYRFAAQVLGGGGVRPPHHRHHHHHQTTLQHACDPQSFVRALRSVQDQDRLWRDATGAREPYFSPFTRGRGGSRAAGGGGDYGGSDEYGGSSSSSSGGGGGGGGGFNGRGGTGLEGGGPNASASLPEIRIGGELKTIQPNDYNEYERKFLSDLIDPRAIQTTFDDIVLPAATKESLQALTSLALVRPEAFQYGVLAAERIPGCLLYGPPGTGKTLLAKAVAHQSGANMLEVSAASINDMWVGNSEKNVQALFSLARKIAPVVLFLDEADALLGARQTRPGRGGHRETINQFLREWDGLDGQMKAFVMVATNRPFDLDEAVLRRLPRRILVDLPLAAGRLAILRVLLRDEVLDPAVSLETLAGADTELYSGSDLKNLCVAAAMEAVREEVRNRDAAAAGTAYPQRRVLRPAHFAQALAEIGSSTSEDMASLQAIRRFDERYGDKRRKTRRHMGFVVGPTKLGSEGAMVRRPAAS